MQKTLGKLHKFKCLKAIDVFVPIFGPNLMSLNIHEPTTAPTGILWTVFHLSNNQ